MSRWRIVLRCVRNLISMLVLSSELWFAWIRPNEHRRCQLFGFQKKGLQGWSSAHPPSASCTSWADPIILTHSKQVRGHALCLLGVSIMGPLGAGAFEWHRLWMCAILFNLCALPSARLPACLVCRPVTFIQPQRTKDGLLPANAEEKGKGERG